MDGRFFDSLFQEEMLAALENAALLACLIRQWNNGKLGMALKTYYSFFMLCSFVFLPVLYYWNLLGFQF